MLSNLPLTLILATAAAAALLWRWPRVRATTLRAPVLWGVGAIGLLVVAALFRRSGAQQASPSSTAMAWQFLAGLGALCPAVALLGAKRPQHSAWQFIVASLFVVLGLPALRVLLLGGGQAVDLHLAQAWFLLVLVFMCGTNHLPTRYALSAVLYLAGECVLVGPWLPGAGLLAGPTVLQAHAPLVALGLFTLALLLVPVMRRRSHARLALDELWLDFRDTFGVVWGLRVQQRINQSAVMYDWPLRLEWHGLVFPLEQPLPPTVEKAVQDHFKNLLRRFVSPEWINERLQPVDVRG